MLKNGVLTTSTLSLSVAFVSTQLLPAIHKQGLESL